MPELQLLRADHAHAVLQFEVSNRVYFAAYVSDRGDDYFEHFAEHHAQLLSDQASGDAAYYVLVADSGAILGRFNIWFADDTSARLGYRMAESATGRGDATAAVEKICRLALSQHGVHTVTAAVSHGNPASQRVLAKAGLWSAAQRTQRRSQRGKEVVSVDLFVRRDRDITVGQVDGKLKWPLHPPILPTQPPQGEEVAFGHGRGGWGSGRSRGEFDPVPSSAAVMGDHQRGVVVGGDREADFPCDEVDG